MAFDFNSAIWQLVKQSDWVSKYVVLLGLTILSISCVAIIIYKYLEFRKHKKSLLGALGSLKNARTLQDLVSHSREYQDSLAGSLLTKSIADFKNLLEEKKEMWDSTETTSQSLTQDIALLEMQINQHIDSIVFEQETHIPILGTAAAVGPLVGLFGTIWGLIHSFVNISQERSADIATVAPGIAEALITTLAGLIVAIPALIAFNYYSNELRKIEAQLAECGEIILLICKKSLILTPRAFDAKKTTIRPTI